MAKNLSDDILNLLFSFLGTHEISCITGIECSLCKHYKNLKLIDQDIDHDLIKNYCIADKNIVNEIELKKITNKTQRIHVIGNAWKIINSLKHRKFAFYSGLSMLVNGNAFPERLSTCKKDSICITESNLNIAKKIENKIENKMIITQSYDYHFENSKSKSIDFLLIEKEYIDRFIFYNHFAIPEFDIPEKGYLVIDLRNNETFYTN